MHPSLSRYHRQMLLPGIGEEGQKQLGRSTALVVGCGALGTVLCDALARSGVGHLIIVDRDTVELTNLQRQVLFDEADVQEAMPKAEAAKRKIARINSQVRVTAIVDDLNHLNVEKMLFGGGSPGSAERRVDVIVDGTDNFETRFLINDVAVKHSIPYVYAGAVGTFGMTFPILPHGGGGTEESAPWEEAGRVTPCLRCLFDQAPPPGANPTCETAGVLGPIVSIIASHEAAEAIKILTGNWDAVNRSILQVDLWTNQIHQFDVAGAYDAGDCACCRHRRFEYLEGGKGGSATTLCGRNAVQLARRQSNGRLDFDKIAERLRHHGKVMTNPFMLRAQITDHGAPYELTLFHDGRAIVKGTEESKVARSIYDKYVGG